MHIRACAEILPSEVFDYRPALKDCFGKGEIAHGRLHSGHYVECPSFLFQNIQLTNATFERPGVCPTAIHDESSDWFQGDHDVVFREPGLLKPAAVM